MAVLIQKQESFDFLKVSDVFVNAGHSAKCCKQMVEFWKKSQFCDVNLIIINNYGTPTACVAAHRVVIASSIPFFAVMFGIQMKNSEVDREVSLHGYESTAVKAIIEYAYTGKLEITDLNVQDILVTAKRFTLPDIVSFCIDFMSKELSPSNSLGIREFSKTQDLVDLHKSAKEYVVQNFSSVSKEEEFLCLPVEQVVELVKSDDIVVNSEEDVYNAVTKWLEHDLDARSKHADDLYDHVRFPITSQRFLETVASKNKLLLSTDKGKVYLKDGFEYHENPAAIIFSNPKKTNPRRSVQGIICVVGGESNSNTTLNSFTLCNPHEEEWREGPPMKYKRSRLAVAIVQGELYAIGGYDLGYSLTLCEKYSAADNRWEEIAPLNNARSNLAAIPVGRRLLAIGGYTGSVHLQSVELYDPSTDEWTSGPPMLEPRSELSAVYLNQYVYAICGRNSKGDLRSVERFDLLNKKWEFISSLNSPRTGGG